MDDSAGTTPRRQPDDFGRQGPTRRRLLQLAGGTLLGGVAASILYACSSPGPTSPSTSGSASPVADALVDPSGAVPTQTHNDALVGRRSSACH